MLLRFYVFKLVFISYVNFFLPFSFWYVYADFDFNSFFI